jgi:hypothetical protein
MILNLLVIQDDTNQYQICKVFDLIKAYVVYYYLFALGHFTPVWPQPLYTTFSLLFQDIYGSLLLLDVCTQNN